MTTSAEPRLAPPGAGLPAMELFFARRIFARKLARGDREGFLREFEHERAAIRLLLDSVPREEWGERALIRRLPGLEDSSRHWSIAMTLDHLRITNRAFAGVVVDLAREIPPPGQASTAAVKPSPSADQEIETDFERSCDDLGAAVAAVENLRTPLRYAHPWFGPLDAFGWWALSAMHLGIHRRQIAAIRKRLRERS